MPGNSTPAGGEEFEYSDGDMVLAAYVSGAGSRPGPTVLLCHEWSGLNHGMRGIADRIAALGYVCFALDVYGKGVRGEESGDNSHLMGPLMAIAKYCGIGFSQACVPRGLTPESIRGGLL